MIESKEDTYHGIWFLPDSQTLVKGHLTVTDFVIDLQLTDPKDRRLCPEADTRDIEEQRFPVIHGIGQYGEKITLYDCTGFSDSFSARLMLYGDAHYMAMDTQKFKILGVHIPGFDNWINSDSFRKVSDEAGFSILFSEVEDSKIGFDYTYDNEFKRKVKQSRNYYTYYNPNLKNKAAKGMNLKRWQYLAAR